MAKEYPERPPTDAGEFASDVVAMLDWLKKNRITEYNGNKSRDVRKVAFGLNLIRDLLDQCRKRITPRDFPKTGILEAYAILNHLETGRQHPVSTHIKGIHSERFRSNRAPAHLIEIEGRNVTIGAVRAYREVTRLSENAARKKFVEEATNNEIPLTINMIKKWEDRSKHPDDVKPENAVPEMGPDAWKNHILKLAGNNPQNVFNLGMEIIWQWWGVPRL